MGALASFNEGRAIPHIVDRLEDPCDRAAAAEALLAFGRAAIPALGATLAERRPSLEDEAPVSAERRADAARLLGLMADRSVVPRLCSCLDDSAPAVQLEASLALVALMSMEAPDRALALLAEGLKESSVVVQARCADALVVMGDRAIPHLLSGGGPRPTPASGLRRPADDARQVSVIEILERIGTEASVRALQDFLRDRSSLVWDRARRALEIFRRMADDALIYRCLLN